MGLKRTSLKLPLLLCFLAGGSALAIEQQPLVSNDVINWVAKSNKNPTLVAWYGDLTFDDAAKKLVFVSGKQSFDAGYDSVRRVVVDKATHMHPRRAAWKQIDEERKQGSGDPNGDCWMHLEVATPGAPEAKYMLQVPDQFSAQVLDKARQVFAGRVAVTDVRVGALFDRKKLKDVESKHTFELAESRKIHPVPELKPDQALIVVVYPIYADYGGGIFNIGAQKYHEAGEAYARQVKIHANDRVILVNTVGTYGFAYLDPGDYQIVAQSQTASALQTTVEAGKAYYFLEDDFGGSGAGYRIQLSQHSPELVMFKLGEAWSGTWTRKSK